MRTTPPRPPPASSSNSSRARLRARSQPARTTARRGPRPPPPPRRSRLHPTPLSTWAPAPQVVRLQHPVCRKHLCCWNLFSPKSNFMTVIHEYFPTKNRESKKKLTSFCFNYEHFIRSHPISEVLRVMLFFRLDDLPYTGCYMLNLH